MTNSYQIIELSNNTMSSNDSEKFLEDQVKDTEYKLQHLAAEYDHLDQKKYVLVQELCERKERLYEQQGKATNTIAREVLEYVNSIGIIGTVGGTLYDRIDTRYKNENALTFIKGLGLADAKSESLNKSPEEKIEELTQDIQEELETLPTSRKHKAIKKVKEQIKEDEVEDKDITVKVDSGVHQPEPPKTMQGPNNYSEAVRKTARWFYATGKHYDKIADEIETYKPTTDKRINEKTGYWYLYVHKKIITDILDPIFNMETKAEADRKWSTSVEHWIGIIRNRIIQSKHGAGKMAENTLTDPFGRTVYNHKNKAIKKAISRERVGDFERPVVEMAMKIIAANKGLSALHDWLENDQGGYRRYRKEFLHDYFAEASMGSIKSGNPDYPQFMEDYKKKQLEKFKQV